MAQLTKNYDVEIQTHHLTDRSTDKLGKLAYVTLSEEFIVYSNDYLVPFHALDTAVVTTSMDRPPTIIGADNVDIWEGSAFDPMAGVSAVDKDGNFIPVTYTGTVDTTVPGDYWLTYSATDSEGVTATARRRVRVKVIPAPHFTGLRNHTTNQGVPIDLRDGVHAWIESTEITYTVSPATLEECNVGTHVITYSAEANGKVTTETINWTITQANDPTIYNNSTMIVYINTEFDPLQDLYARDDNGNLVDVLLDEELYTLTSTVDGVDDESDYLKDAVVNLYEPTSRIPGGYAFDGWYDNSSYTGTPLTSVTMSADKQIWCKIVPTYTLTKTIEGVDTVETYKQGTGVELNPPLIPDTRKRFKGWYENSSYTGDPIGAITMDANKHVYAKVVNLEGYAMLDGGTLRLFLDEEGKYDTDPTVLKDIENSTTSPWGNVLGINRVEIRDAIQPKSMRQWFNVQQYTSLNSIQAIVGLENLDTSKCTNFEDIFVNLLISGYYDLSSWDVSAGTSFLGMFNACGFTSINCTGWRFKDGISSSAADYMFAFSSSLTSIYADADWSQTFNSSNMFQGCNALRGGQGSSYSNLGDASSAKARPDGGTSAPGYFTDNA